MDLNVYAERFKLLFESPSKATIKGTIMQIEKGHINDCLHISKVSRKFRIPTIYNFSVIYL